MSHMGLGPVIARLRGPYPASVVMRPRFKKRLGRGLRQEQRKGKEELGGRATKHSALSASKRIPKPGQCLDVVNGD